MEASSDDFSSDFMKYSIILVQVVEISSEESKNSGADDFDDHVDDFEDLA